MRAILLTLILAIAACGGSSGSNNSNMSSSANSQPMETQVKLVPLPASVTLQDENLNLGLDAHLQLGVDNLISAANR